ncbi:MAG: CHAT domain-containing protein [Chitinophagaceae bacterium]|nr:CHAT domain-containing protein [Chitinophagaceae bacterium]
MQTDSLSAYLEKLFDLTDDDAYYFSNKADSVLKTLWRKPKSPNEQEAYLDFVLNIAYHLLQQGQIAASTRWYETGLNYQQQNAVNYETEEFIIKPLGNNYVRMGDYDKAVALQQSAIEQAFKTEKKELLASLYSNLAISFFWLKDYKAVQLYCNTGLQYVSPAKATTGFLYNVKADAFFEEGRKDSAIYFNQKALEFFRSPDAFEADAAWMVSALELSSKLLAEKQQFAEAVIKLQNAEKIINESYPDTRQRDKAKLKIEKGNLFLKLRQYDSSLSNFQQGLAYFSIDTNGFYPDHTVAALYAGIARTWNEKNTDSSLFYYQRAVANDYYSSQLITGSANSLQTLMTDTLISHEAISLFYRQYKKTGNTSLPGRMLWLMELSKGRQLLNEVNRTKQWQHDSAMQQQQYLFAQLRNDYLLLAETRDSVQQSNISKRIREQELQLGLQENRFAQLLQQPSFEVFLKQMQSTSSSATLLSYYTGADSLYVVIMNKEVLNVKAIALREEQAVEKFINNYFASAAAFNNNPAAYFTAANHLFKTILPFQMQLAPLIVSADGVLNRLPFEALCVNGEQQFLGETQPVSYVYSLLQYVNNQTSSGAVLPLTVYTFSKEHTGFAALPSSKTEALVLKKQFDASVTEASEVGENDFVNRMQDYSVLHIAAHAVASENSTPYLVLKNKFYIGQLQYTEINCPLVVLTACETAAGSLQTGEGVVSIGRAFIAKGVKGVVASRWKVDDAVAPVFIKSFYSSLKQTESPAAALFEARKNYLKNASNLSQKNPVQWAGFLYAGAEQQIKLKERSTFNWYWLMLLFIPIAFIIHRQRK